MSRRMTARMAIVNLALVSLAACSSTTEQGAVGVERKQLLIVSSAEMDQAAAAAYQNVLKEQSPKGNVNKDTSGSSRRPLCSVRTRRSGSGR
jgi:hypothetical protein